MNIPTLSENVSKWKIIYEREGAEGLLMKYKGSKGYLGADSRKEIIGYIEECEYQWFGQFFESHIFLFYSNS